MKPLRAALGSWTPAPGLSTDPIATLRAAWPDIVGADVAANSSPAEIVREALLIVTRSSAWSQQLSFLSERIVARVRERSGTEIERLRFRVGRVREAQNAAASGSRRHRSVRTRAYAPAETLEDAFARFRADVTAAQRAKLHAGWKECGNCGVAIAPSSGLLCVPCTNRRREEREAHVARLLFDVPWLGYTGVSALVDGLTREEYQALRLRLLRRWRDVLERVRRSGAKTLTTRERMIASSYVLLRSELDPERIAPVVVRELLGEELHQLLYGN